ncbi:MAG: sulfite exporter TauE/SafE family protein, partial [Patescibacteria group bacterium]
MKNFLTSTTPQTYQFNFSDKNKLKIISFFASGLGGFFGAAGALCFNWLVQWWLERDMKRVNGLALFTISLSVATSIVIRIFLPIQIIHADWRKINILIISIACGILGVVFGKLYEKKLKEKHLRQLFVGILLFVGFKLLGFLPGQLFSSLSVDAWTTTAVWSLIAGISSPLLGMGVGVFLVPAFIGIGFSPDEGILMSLITSVIVMLLGAWFFHKAGRLDAQDMRYVWLPAIIGAPVGVWASYQISPEYFQHLFGILLIVGASKIFYDISTRFQKFIHAVFSLCASK